MTKIPVRSQQAKNPSSSAEGAGEARTPMALPLDAPEQALGALGLSNPGTTPTEKTPVADLLLYALAPYGGPRPELAVVLGVAAELEAWAMFMEGPLSITAEMMARRLRVAVDLAKRME